MHETEAGAGDQVRKERRQHDLPVSVDPASAESPGDVDHLRINAARTMIGGQHHIADRGDKDDRHPELEASAEQHHEDALDSLNDSKTQSPLVLVDPVQHDRNAAAALTEDAYERFRSAAVEYLQAHDKASFFTLVPLSPETFREEHPDTTVILVTLTPLDDKHDVAGAKCMKVFQHLGRELANAGFTVLDASWEFGDEAILLYAVDKEPLPEEEVLIGPPEDMEEHAEQFRKQHTNVFVEDGRLFAKEQRQYREPLPFLQHAITDTYVQERVQRAQVQLIK